MADDTTDFVAELRDELTDTEVEIERLETLSTRFGTSLSTSLRAAITDGKSFKSVLVDISSAFVDITLKAALKPVSILASGLIDSLFSATDVSLTQFAKGGVLSAPRYFPLSGGLGVAGEAGAEAGTAADARQRRTAGRGFQRVGADLDFDECHGQRCQKLCRRRGRDERHAVACRQARHEGQLRWLFIISAFRSTSPSMRGAGRSG